MAEARQIVQCCTEAGVPLMINENTRHQPWFRQAKEILESGALGDLFYCPLREPQPRLL